MAAGAELRLVTWGGAGQLFADKKAWLGSGKGVVKTSNISFF